MSRVYNWDGETLVNGKGKTIFGEGDYGFNPKDNNWYALVPGNHLANLVKHNVVEHEDGTITVTPSIKVGIGDGQGGSIEAWHGYLTKGKFISC